MEKQAHQEKGSQKKRTRTNGNKTYSINDFTAAKVFTATKAAEREKLGEAITEWLQNNKVQIVDKSITQSSDQAFHCLTVILFYRRLGNGQS
jgi:hypothetical protein